MAFSKRYISPISHEANADWTNPANCYDGNTGTYAQVSVVSSGLITNCKADTYGRNVQVYVYHYGSDPSVKIEVYYNGAWDIVKNGTIPNSSWQTFSIAAALPQLLEKIRITYNTGAPYPLTLCEVRYETVWSTPASHNDPSGEWIYETQAYDEDGDTESINGTGDYGEAYCLELIPPADFSGDSEALRFLAYINETGTLKVDIYNGSTWTNIYEGPGSLSKEWIMREFAAQPVTKCRFYKNTEPFALIQVFEVDFCQEYPWGGAGGVALIDNHYRQMRT